MEQLGTCNYSGFKHIENSECQGWKPCEPVLAPAVRPRQHSYDDCGTDDCLACRDINNPHAETVAGETQPEPLCERCHHVHVRVTRDGSKRGVCTEICPCLVYAPPAADHVAGEMKITSWRNLPSEEHGVERAEVVVKFVADETHLELCQCGHSRGLHTKAGACGVALCDCRKFAAPSVAAPAEGKHKPSCKSRIRSVYTLKQDCDCGASTPLPADLRMIKVWSFYDAPKELRNRSPHGGDEDWLALVPKTLAETWIPWLEDHGPFGVCEISREVLEDGSILCIGAHA